MSRLSYSVDRHLGISGLDAVGTVIEHDFLDIPFLSRQIERRGLPVAGEEHPLADPGSSKELQ